MDPGWEIWRGGLSDFLTGPRLGDTEGILVGNFGTAPGWGNQKDFFVGNRESEALGETGGDVFGRSERGCHSVKRTGPGLVNVRNGCWVGSVGGRLLRGAKTKVVFS